MKRFVILALLFALPVQMLWASGVGHCLLGSDRADYVPGAHEHHEAKHAHDHAHAAGDTGHGAGNAADCSAFHFAAIDASTANPPVLAEMGVLGFDAVSAFYKSHIPPGPDRPRWRFAA